MSSERERRSESPGVGNPASPADSLRSPRDIPARGETILGKYEVEQVLGVGGMGVVVAARHLQLGQRVAIKFVKGDAAKDPNVAARFLREARAAGALSGEHVAKVFDVGTLENGSPFMVMEHLAGVDLGALLQRDGPLGIPEALAAVLQACEAIAEAHSLGIVHRDLKPSNLFVSRRADGTQLIKVLDFGISKALDTPINQSLTASGSLMGSPGYMSPEQVRSPKTVDARTDVWALGVILYELLTGRAPFTGETVGETFARIVSEPAAPIRDLRPEVPQGLAAVIAQCLARDIEHRLQSVAALAVRLHPFAPPEAEISVARIRRIAGATPGGTNTATFAAPLDAPGLPLARHPTPGTRQSQPSVATASVWQQGGAPGAVADRSRKRLLFGAVGALALAGAGLSIAALRGPAASPPVAGRLASTVSVAPPPAAAAPVTLDAPDALRTVVEGPSASAPMDAGNPAVPHVGRHFVSPHILSETNDHERPSAAKKAPQAPDPTSTTTTDEKDIF